MKSDNEIDPSIPDPNANLIRRDKDGEIIAPGSVMIEPQSYEQLVAGLRLAAEGAAHLAAGALVGNDRGLAALYAGLATRLDMVRMLAVKVAKIEESTLNQRETQLPRSAPMGYMAARRRFLDGLKRSSGAARQLAICHRGDIRFSQMAESLLSMHSTHVRGPAIIKPPPRGIVGMH